ncbi:thioredoxin family protein [Flagellimonas sp. HMM57]|uniref:thioredoxin family protein n=1 Tax=unclassified Flagellimonas TaxID=2644544 RepID=UPI0013D5572A|nr:MULTISPECIES: thioredoxin family protein [unclassified Flagellimonas]UII74846.1 thioredoxin family protein [Flagellimonas sp. HMM57]
MKSSFFTLLFISISFSYGQEFNKEVTMENGKKYMVGKINLEGLESEPYQAWYNVGYDSYTVDKDLVNMFKKPLAKHEVKLFLGTWCGDSKREVPRIIKILKAAKFPMEQLEIVALDRRKEHYKKSPTGEEKGLDIIKVPTMIFFKNGEEVNRIVESPIESLEEDMVQIVKKKPYTPNYATLSKSN